MRFCIGMKPQERPIEKGKGTKAEKRSKIREWD
jgi:hypothetical protein